MLNCIITNNYYSDFIILIDDKKIIDYKYIDGRLEFKIPLEPKVHTLRLYFKNARKDIRTDSKLMLNNSKEKSFEQSDFNYLLDFKSKDTSILQICLLKEDVCVCNKTINYYTVNFEGSKNINIINDCYDFNSLKMKGIILIIKQYFWSLLFESICALQFGYWAFFTGNIDLNNRALIIFPFTICILFVTLVKISTSFIDWKFKVLNIMETVNRKTGDGSVS